MGVGGQLCALAALYLGKELPELVEKGTGWFRDKPWYLGCPACSLTTMPAELFQLFLWS
jgi:hypothetical protein